MADKDKYEVGYGKPPRHTRFKKGQSGNPSGRPKMVLTHEEIVTRELDRRVTITEDGKKKRLTKREVMHKSMVQKAMKGDLKAARMIIDLDQANKLGPSIPQEEKMIFTLVFEEEEQRRLEHLREGDPDIF